MRKNNKTDKPASNLYKLANKNAGNIDLAIEVRGIAKYVLK